MDREREHIETLKEGSDIVEVAEELECLPTRREGSRYQGICCPKGPHTDSEGGRCYAVFPDRQSFLCWHCGASGDVIDLAGNKLGLDFVGATDWLAERAGLPRLNESAMSPEERKRSEEKRRVHEILTKATSYFHKCLMDDESMVDWVRQNYGLERQTMEDFMLGYALGEGLMEHLQGLVYSEADITSTALFVKVGEKWKEFFQGRIVFPFLKSGRTVNMTGRKTPKTPSHECEERKYRKLPKRSKKMPWLSEFIDHDCFFNEDAARGADEVFVAEGVADTMALSQAGYQAISPATNQISERLLDRFEHLTTKAESIFLVPDIESNNSGMEGALATGALPVFAGLGATKGKVGKNAYPKQRSVHSIYERPAWPGP